MAQLTEIASLTERRRLLLSDSATLRNQIAADLANLRPAVAWVETGYVAFRSLRALSPVVALAGGFLVTRKGTSLFRLVRKAGSLWKIGKYLPTLWRRFR